MGTSASVQTNITNITNSVQNEINQKVSVSSNTKCNITIDSIKFNKTKGCEISVENKCYAESSALLETIQKLMIDFYNNLDVNQKQEAAAWFTATFGVSTSSSNIINDFKNTVNQTCDAYVNENQNITVKSIEINECTAPEGQVIVFKFLNAGTAKAQCGMKVLTDLAVTATNDIAVKQSQGLNWSQFLWPIIIAIIVITALYTVFKLLYAKIPSTQDRIELTKLSQNNYMTRISSLLDIRNK